MVIVAHRAMRDLIVELLDHDRDDWAVSAAASVSELDHAADRQPNLIIIDTADFAAVRRLLPPTVSLSGIVVIGPEQHPAYRDAALALGAGGWLSRENVAEDLGDTLRSACSGRGRGLAARRPRPTG